MTFGGHRGTEIAAFGGKDDKNAEGAYGLVFIFEFLASKSDLIFKREYNDNVVER